jgi:ATP-dependent RNA helicase SUPV3L1/SUV3
MFQSGDVDYLVATDAVGMGLNLDVDHVAFASDRKYDGYQFRRLNPSEFAQIAGRAGRATRDGTFGTTGRCAPFEPELVNALQNHTFDSVKVLQWRNSKLDFSSLGALQVSLAQTPSHEALTRAPIAEDLRVLDHAARDAEVRDMAQGKAAVERLWDACQIPDYRKIAPAAHAELVTTLFGFLMRQGTIPDAWFATQIDQADRIDGDIDTLSGRIAQIRTWTFVANRPDWLKDPEHSQETTREVENKLSDALHERLTERFVDRRTSVLMRRLRENASLNTEIGKTGEVIVEGHAIGRLDGFTFAPETAEAGSDAKALQAAAQKALAGEIDARAEKLAAAPDENFVLASDGTLRWTGDAVGKLMPAEDALHPRLRIIADERLTGASREKVQARLDLWLKTHIEKLLGPLFELSKAEDISGIARGIAFQLVEALGVLERTKIAAEMKDLDQPSRAALRKYGVRFGAYHIYFPGLLKPAARALASLLWAEKQDNADLLALSNAQHMASSGRTSFPIDKALPRDAYRVLGYRQCGERAVRVDILERLADLIRPALAWRENAPGAKPPGAFDGRGFVVTQAMTSLTGSAGEDFASVLRALGYRMDRRPPLPPKAEPVAAPAAEPESKEVESKEVEGQEAGGQEAAPAEMSADAPVEFTTEAAGEPAAEAAAQPVSGDPAPSSALLPHVALFETAPVAATEAEPEVLAEPADTPVAEAVPDQTVTEAAPEIPAEAFAASEAPSIETAAIEAETPATDAPAADAAPADAVVAAAVPEVAAEPQLVEVWRPGGRSEERRPRHDRNRHRPRQAPQDGAAAAAPGAAGDGERRERHRPGRRDRNQELKDFRKPREAVPADASAPAAADGAPRREHNNDRPRERFEGKGADKGSDRGAEGRGDGRGKDRDRDKGRRDNKFGGKGGDRDRSGRDKGGPSHRPFATSAAPRERDRVADPNSPFAKLAALKEQLTANRKD